MFDNSKIIITSDHGELMGEENIFFSHGIFTYLALINVPLIIKNPYQKRGNYINKNFSLIDVLYNKKRVIKGNIIFSFHPKSFSFLSTEKIYLIHLNQLDVVDNKSFHLFPINNSYSFSRLKKM